MPRLCVGSPTNTWYPCSIVDANGKEIPWVDQEGNELKSVADRTRDWREAQPTPDLEDLIKKGEYVLPLYADLPSMPEHERRAIFGLMVGNEGKTRVRVYQAYTQAGFDPNKDMLQAPIIPPEVGGEGLGNPIWRHGGGGPVVIDWDLRASLEGLYATGIRSAMSVLGAIGMELPLNQRVGWKRKETGELFRVGMKDPPPPYTRPPVG